MSAPFFLGGDSASVSSNDADSTIYQDTLPRSDFLTENFNPSEYLSTLAENHQTLEDLREDLSERSKALSKELLDLVNDNYEQFLSLGSDLRGGEEKVEDVRVGMLGLQRGFQEVKSQITTRRQKTDELFEQKKEINHQISAGRKMLELDARLEELEEKLMVASLVREAQEDAWSESEDGDDDELEEFAMEEKRIKELQRLVKDYEQIGQLSLAIGDSLFVAAQTQRADRIRNVLLLDLSTELKKANGGGDSSRGRLVEVLGIYRDMGENAEAVKVLKNLRS